MRLRQRLAGLIQLENFSAWHGVPFASENNGFGGTNAKLEFNKPLQVKHIELLEAMNKKGDFTYFGRKDESTEKFYNGDCAITTASSGSLADIKHYAKFNYGVGMMPYDADAKTRRRTPSSAGQPVGDEWQRRRHLQGRGRVPAVPGAAGNRRRMAPEDRLSADHHRGLRSDQATGLLRQEPGCRRRHSPDAEQAAVAVHQGLRLGNMPQIRSVVDEELEGVWTGKKTPQQALDAAVQRGDVLLRRFEASTK